MPPNRTSPILLADDIALDPSHGKRSQGVRSGIGKLAKRLGTTVDLVHIEDLYLYPVKTKAYKAIIEQFFESQKIRLREIAKSIGVPTRARFVHGDPVKKILSLASRRGAYEMVALGTHGRKGISRLILGSVAEEILRKATLPVFTMGPRAQEKSSSFLENQELRILVPTSLTANTVKAEAYAISLARRLGAQIVYFHSLLDTLHPVMQTALTAPGGSRDLMDLVDRLKRDADEKLRAKVDALRKKEIPASFVLETREFSASEAILKEAKTSTASLIVMGTHGRSLIPGAFFGRTARAVILESTVPVITVRSLKS